MGRATTTTNTTNNNEDDEGDAGGWIDDDDNDDDGRTDAKTQDFPDFASETARCASAVQTRPLAVCAA